MIKLIVFDFDGVIIDSHAAYFACYHQALVAVGAHMDPQEEKNIIIKEWGKGYVTQLRSLLKNHPELLDEALKKYQNYRNSDKFQSAVSLFNGSKETLQSLSQHYIIAVATGIRKPHFHKYLDLYDLHVFKQEFTLDDIEDEENYKPAPYMLLKLMEHFGVTKDETVYVGDAENDVTMAQAAGVTPIVVLTGHLNKKEAEELGVTYIIQNITELETLPLFMFT
jgi:HAD superfamily hydrolase (TIGR01549 family)